MKEKMKEEIEVKYLEVLHSFRNTVDILDDKMASGRPYGKAEFKKLLLKISDAYILLLEG